jgi:hypothetical protein
MSRRALACLSVCACVNALLVACSLTVDTSGLAGPGNVVPDSGDASVVDATAEASVDGSPVVDAGRDAARDPSLVAEYSFEEQPGATTSRDSSGNDLHGLVQGDATFVTDGVRGRALKVGGTGFFVVNALAAGLFPRTGTLSFWFRFDFPPLTGPGRSVFDNWDKTRSHVFVRYQDTGNPGEFQVALQPGAASGGYAAVAGFSPQRNKWTHVVVTWDEAAQEGAAFIDGAILGRGPYDQPFVPTGQLFRMGESLVGGIDEVRLFRRAFTDAEALALD